MGDCRSGVFLTKAQANDFIVGLMSIMYDEIDESREWRTFNEQIIASLFELVANYDDDLICLDAITEALSNQLNQLLPDIQERVFDVSGYILRGEEGLLGDYQSQGLHFSVDRDGIENLELTDYQLRWTDPDGSLNFAGFVEYLGTIDTTAQIKAIEDLTARQRHELFSNLQEIGQLMQIDEGVRSQFDAPDNYQLAWTDSDNSMNLAGFLEYLSSLDPFLQKVAISRLNETQRDELFEYVQRDDQEETLKSIDNSTRRAFGLPSNEELFMSAFQEVSLYEQVLVAKEMLKRWSLEKTVSLAEFRAAINELPTEILGQPYGITKRLFDQLYAAAALRQEKYKVLEPLVEDFEKQARDIVIRFILENIPTAARVALDGGDPNEIVPCFDEGIEKTIDGGGIPEEWTTMPIEDLIALYESLSRRALTECGYASDPDFRASVDSVDRTLHERMAEFGRVMAEYFEDGEKVERYYNLRSSDHMTLLNVIWEFSSQAGSLVFEPIDILLSTKDIIQDYLQDDLGVGTGIVAAGIFLPGSFRFLRRIPRIRSIPYIDNMLRNIEAEYLVRQYGLLPQNVSFEGIHSKNLWPALDEFYELASEYPEALRNSSSRFRSFGSVLPKPVEMSFRDRYGGLPRDLTDAPAMAGNDGTFWLNKDFWGHNNYNEIIKTMADKGLAPSGIQFLHVDDGGRINERFWRSYVRHEFGHFVWNPMLEADPHLWEEFSKKFALINLNDIKLYDPALAKTFSEDPKKFAEELFAELFAASKRGYAPSEWQIYLPDFSLWLDEKWRNWRMSR